MCNCIKRNTRMKGCKFSKNKKPRHPSKLCQKWHERGSTLRTHKYQVSSNKMLPHRWHRIWELRGAAGTVPFCLRFLDHYTPHDKKMRIIMLQVIHDRFHFLACSEWQQFMNYLTHYYYYSHMFQLLIITISGIIITHRSTGG
jgi:hypothetical protein